MSQHKPQKRQQQSSCACERVQPKEPRGELRIGCGRSGSRCCCVDLHCCGPAPLQSLPTASPVTVGCLPTSLHSQRAPALASASCHGQSVRSVRVSHTQLGVSTSCRAPLLSAWHGFCAPSWSRTFGNLSICSLTNAGPARKQLLYLYCGFFYTGAGLHDLFDREAVFEDPCGCESTGPRATHRA